MTLTNDELKSRFADRILKLEAENKRLREALESATSWIEASIMAAMVEATTREAMVDAADRARQVLTEGGDDE